MPHSSAITILAPAKINLYLHITKRRDDGYHELQSLVAFADVGDLIRVRKSSSFSFSIDGPYKRGFNSYETDASERSQNIAVKAAYGLAKLADKDLDVDLRLTKNLPLAAGLGGGSADAAAVILALLEYWGLRSDNIEGFDDFTLSLGADVPACLSSKAVYVSGIGESVSPCDHMKEIPAVLINPNERCATADVFSSFKGPYSEMISYDGEDLIDFIKSQRNDLSAAAIAICPSISKILEFLNEQQTCFLARMSGSGATCFGLFEDELDALDVATELSQNNPDWWVRTANLGRVERY